LNYATTLIFAYELLFSSAATRQLWKNTTADFARNQ